MLQLLHKDPAKRLGHGETGTADVMGHPFFEGLDWDQVFRKELKAPYKPKVRGKADTSNFDSEFTSEAVVDSIVPTTAMAAAADFKGFTFAEKSTIESKEREA